MPRQPLTISQTLYQGIVLYLMSFASMIPLMALLGAAYFMLELPSIWVRILAITAFVILQYMMIYHLHRVAEYKPSTLKHVIVKTTSLMPACLMAGLLNRIIIFFGLLLFLIPGIILGVSLRFYACAMLLDGQRMFEAFKYSHRLVCQVWWTTLVVLMAAAVLLLGIDTLAIVMAKPLFGLDVSFYNFFMQIPTTETQIQLDAMIPHKINYLANAYFAVITAVAYPLPLAITLTQYYHLKTLQSGMKLKPGRRVLVA